MKKILLMAMALLMILSMELTVMAAELNLSFREQTAEPGQIIYLSVSLSEQVRGNSMAVTITVSEELTWVPGSSSWSKDGVLKDFGMMGNAGVWTTDQSCNLAGEMCVLAFRVNENADLSKAQVQCTLVVKDGAETVGTYEAEAFFNSSCIHDYGKWESASQFGHNRVCKLCGANQTRIHSWDQGVVAQDPNTPTLGIKTYTCADCGDTKTEKVDWIPEETEPTLPSAPSQDSTTKPSGGITFPTVGDHSHQHTTAGGDSGARENDTLLSVMVVAGSLLVGGGLIFVVILRSKKPQKSEK